MTLHPGPHPPPVLSAHLQQRRLPDCATGSRFSGHLAALMLQHGARAPAIQVSAELLSDIARTESANLSDATRMGVARAEGVLELRYHTAYTFDLRDARRRYDRARRGLLGRLLSDLRASAGDLVSWFTPTDALAILNLNDDMAQDELWSHHPPHWQRLPLEVQSRLARDVRRGLTRHFAGEIPLGTLDTHRLGATLALDRLHLPASEVQGALCQLPRDLQLGARACVDITRTLARHTATLDLEQRSLPRYPEDEDGELANLVFPAVLITAGTGPGTDLTSELLEEEWQQAAQMSELPATLRLPFGTPAEQRHAARAVLHACRALRGIRLALLALGGDDDTGGAEVRA